ncbi:fumarylacetoacetate hydrolase family protein [Mycolicibacterium holsaticum]|uniref:2-keto-4-pentenoate hydratase n=1 Tax=Mycolicibacterium holsaticum TaxID=152142 RepID=UPI000A7BCB09
MNPTGQVSRNTINYVADLLQQAAELRRPIPPIRHLIGAENVDGAYGVQDELVRRRVGDGAVIVGRKIGLTSAAVQQQLGVDQPDFGFLTVDMDVSDAAMIPSHRLLQPKVEAEIAFMLKADLDGDVSDREQLVAAIDYAVAALEVVDSRISQWNLSIADTVADNASCGLFILSKHKVPLTVFEPRNAEMRMFVNDELLSQGDGRACLGDPLDALAWLARAAVRYGNPLRAGQIVLSGALGPMVPAYPGARIRAEIAPLGTILAEFSPSEIA